MDGPLLEAQKRVLSCVPCALGSISPVPKVSTDMKIQMPYSTFKDAFSLIGLWVFEKKTEF